MSATLVDSNGNGFTNTQIDYEYDDSGIRVAQKETVDPTDDGDLVDATTERTDYLVDHQNPTGYAQVLEEKSVAGDVIRAYALGLDVIGHLIATNADTAIVTAVGASIGDFVRLLYDGHGSTRGLVDATGQPLTGQIFAYDAFGNRLDDATALTSLLYSGEQTDATGLQYLRARYYDPRIGAFTRDDPFFGNLDDPQSLHKYLYCHADPVNGIDPSGEFALAAMVSTSGLMGSLRSMNWGAIGSAAARFLSPTPLLAATEGLGSMAFMGAFYLRALGGSILGALDQHYAEYYLSPMIEELHGLANDAKPFKIAKAAEQWADTFSDILDGRGVENAILKPLVWAQLGPVVGLWRFASTMSRTNSLLASAERWVLTEIPVLLEEQNPLIKIEIKRRLEITPMTRFNLDLDIWELSGKGLKKKISPAEDIRKIRIAIRALKRLDLDAAEEHIKDFIHGVNSYGPLSITPEPEWYSP